jgi:hypothetical protein
LLAAALLGVPLVRAAHPPAKKPNVLFIAVDDLNHWVGYLGRNSRTMTPNMDRLAKQPGEGDAVKKDLGKYLPNENKPPAKGGGPSEGGEGGGRKNQKKNRNP